MMSYASQLNALTICTIFNVIINEISQLYGLTGVVVVVVFSKIQYIIIGGGMMHGKNINGLSTHIS